MFWSREENERIRFEDALKHIYDCEYRQMEATVLSLAGILRLKIKRVVGLVSKMENRGLIKVLSDGIHLTPHGRSWALQVIRAHRLWESYLVDEVGLPIEKIHDQAEYKEHVITPAQADRLEAQLGFPVRDPHGDPIPTAAHTIEKKRGICLITWPAGDLAKIVHIEDEPKTIFDQILSEELFLDTRLKVLDSNANGLRVWTSLRECWLAPIVASNIFVESVSEHEFKMEGARLSDLRPGERGKILALAAQGLVRRRFFDFGLLPGTVIEAVLMSAMTEPMAYRVRDTLIALRREQTQKIWIEKL